ncbi:MAG: hypothetical protein R3350_09545, partial [Saprospiraceae bacterium]|nr:hypothetical protein [Saprospiraceae bacterium]
KLQRSDRSMPWVADPWEFSTGMKSRIAATHKTRMSPELRAGFLLLAFRLLPNYLAPSYGQLALFCRRDAAFFLADKM